MSVTSKEQTQSDLAATESTDNTSDKGRSGILQINEGIKSGESKFKVFTFAPSTNDAHDTQKCLDFWEFIESRKDLVPAKAFKLTPLRSVSQKIVQNEEEDADWSSVFGLLQERGLDKTFGNADHCKICTYEKSIECLCEDHFDPTELNDWDPFKKEFADASVLTDFIETREASAQTDFKDASELEREKNLRIMDEIDELFRQLTQSPVVCTIEEENRTEPAKVKNVDSEYSIRSLNKATCVCGKEKCFCAEYYRVLSKISEAIDQANSLDASDIDKCECSTLNLKLIKDYKLLLECKVELQTAWGRKVNQEVVCVCKQEKCPCSIVINLQKEIDNIFGWTRDEPVEKVYCTCKDYYASVIDKLSINTIPSLLTCKCVDCDEDMVESLSNLCTNCVYKRLQNDSPPVCTLERKYSSEMLGERKYSSFADKQNAQIRCSCNKVKNKKRPLSKSILSIEGKKLLRSNSQLKSNESRSYRKTCSIQSQRNESNNLNITPVEYNFEVTGSKCIQNSRDMLYAKPKWSGNVELQKKTCSINGQRWEAYTTPKQSSSSEVRSLTMHQNSPRESCFSVLPDVVEEKSRSQIQKVTCSEPTVKQRESKKNIPESPGKQRDSKRSSNDSSVKQRESKRDSGDSQVKQRESKRDSYMSRSKTKKSEFIHPSKSMQNAVKTQSKFDGIPERSLHRHKMDASNYFRKKSVIQGSYLARNKLKHGSCDKSKDVSKQSINLSQGEPARKESEIEIKDTSNSAEGDAQSLVESAIKSSSVCSATPIGTCQKGKLDTSPFNLYKDDTFSDFNFCDQVNSIYCSGPPSIKQKCSCSFLDEYSKVEGYICASNTPIDSIVNSSTVSKEYSQNITDVNDVQIEGSLTDSLKTSKCTCSESEVKSKPSESKCHLEDQITKSDMCESNKDKNDRKSNLEANESQFEGNNVDNIFKTSCANSMLETNINSPRKKNTDVLEHFVCKDESSNGHLESGEVYNSVINISKINRSHIFSDTNSTKPDAKNIELNHVEPDSECCCNTVLAENNDNNLCEENSSEIKKNIDDSNYCSSELNKNKEDSLLCPPTERVDRNSNNRNTVSKLEILDYKDLQTCCTSRLPVIAEESKKDLRKLRCKDASRSTLSNSSQLMYDSKKFTSTLLDTNRIKNRDSMSLKNIWKNK